MKEFLLTALFCGFLFGYSFSKELPVFTTYNNDEINEINKRKHEEELKDWERLPQEFNVYQTIQFVIPNNKLKAYETVFINLGKISREEAESKIEGYLNKFPPELKQYTSARCLNTTKSIKPPDETDDLELLQVYESEDGVSFVSYGGDINRIAECNEEQIKNKSPNFFEENKKYDFNHDGCILITQTFYRSSSLSKIAPVAKRAKTKPQFYESEPFNATVEGGVVCQEIYGRRDLKYYDDNVTVEIVGGTPNFPCCFKLKKGSYVHAQKFGVNTYIIDFMLKTSSSPMRIRANTLQSNVKFIPKNDGSLFRQ